MKPIEGPDFICIGMPKAGTGWLYDQLSGHPDFWMPPVKELVYLSRGVPRLGFARERHGRAQKRQERALEASRGAERHLRRHRDGRDAAFVEYARTCMNRKMDLERYAGLFRFKGDLMSGDISPTYHSLKAATIAGIAQRFPEVKVLLLVRDPVSRAWSRISMMHRRGEFDPSLCLDASAFRTYLETDHNTGGLRSTVAATAWRAHAPAISFRHFLFDDISNDPENTRADICTYLGADPLKPSNLPADHNRKADLEKLEMSDPIRNVLIEFFADEIMACAEMFGGRARAWPEKYNL